MFRAYSQDDITILYDNGEDNWGEPLATTDVELKAYVAWKSHLVRNLAGAQVVSRAIVYVHSTYTRGLIHKDKIKINGITYAILDITPGKDFSGNHEEAHIQ